MSEVPNIVKESGISRDYIIAFGSLDNYLRRIKMDEPPRLRYLAKRAFLQREFRKYKDYFNQIGESQLVNDQNKEAIERLNAIVDELNKMREEEKVDDERLSSLWKEVNDLINK